MSDDFVITDAKPDKTPVILGLTAPSGAGKTYSALTLAFGICDVLGGKPGIIDTEGRRALRYADKTRYPEFGDFAHMDFQPPFSSDRYGEAMRAMQAKLGGVGTIIVDSMSHEHEGAGGYLDFHDKDLDRMAGTTDWKKREKMTFTAWIKPAAARRRLINGFLQTPMNFIFCFRAKDKIKPVSGGQPVQMGYMAIAGEDFVFEMITRFLLQPGAQGMPDWSDDAFKWGAAKRDRQDVALFPDGERITREMGRRVAQAYGAVGAASRQRAGAAETQASPEEKREAKKRELLEAAEGGNHPLEAAWENLNAAQKKALQSYYDDTLKPTADAADATPGESADDEAL